MAFSKKQIIEFINELIIEPRINCVKWSKLTDQTATLRIGYPGQHLASLVTGVKGEKTGARGNDLIDGSEVKSCSRVDQLDKCKDCDSPVLRTEKKCGSCDSENIKRKEDSKWLFTIRSEDDLKTLVDNPNLNRIVLIIDDYPKFEENDFNDIRLQVFEIYPKKERHRRFKEIMTNYYYKIYLEHKKLDAAKTPAPKNFWPYTYQFYLCNPLLIFRAIIKNAYSENPELIIEKWVENDINRDGITPELMPPNLLKMTEFERIDEKSSEDEIKSILTSGKTIEEFKEMIKQKKKKEVVKIVKFIPENLRSSLELRDTDKIAIAKKKYQRRHIKK